MTEGEDSNITFFLSGDKANIFSGFRKQILQEVGLKEEELRVRPLESFQESGTGLEAAKYKYDLYEEGRKEKIKLVKNALKKRIAHFPGTSHLRNFGNKGNLGNQAELLNPVLEKSLHKLEEAMKKQNSEIAKQIRVSTNRERRFEEEVKRLETQLYDRQKRHSQRNRDLDTKYGSAKQRKIEQDHRRKAIKKIMGESKERMQIHAVELGKSHIKDSEQFREAQSKKEQERSRLIHHSFLLKTQDNESRQLNYFSNIRKNSQETEKQLASFNSRMIRGELNCRRHKEEVVRTASASMRRNAEAFRRSKQEKRFPIEAVKKLWTKYRQMAELAREKERSHVERTKLRRDDYLNHIKKMTETRSYWENLEAERTNELEERRIQREAQALHNRLSSSVVFQSRFAVHNSRFETARKKVQLLKKEEKLARTELLRRQHIREEQIEQFRTYKQHIDLLKTEVASQFAQRRQKSTDLSNPYKIAEMRSTQRYFRIRRAQGSDKLQTNRSLI